MYTRFAAAAAGCLLFALSVTSALADTSSTVVTLTPLFTELINDYVLPVVATLAAALVGWLATVAAGRLHLSISDAMRQRVVDFANIQAKALFAKVVNAHEYNIDVKNPQIAAAAAEAELHVADALRAIGISPASVVAYVGHLIVSHLGDLTKGEPDHATPTGAIPGTTVTPDGATIPATAA